MVKKRITDGTSTSFWHDPWLGGPPLAKRVDASIKEASGIHDQATLSTLIIAGTWNCSHFAMPAAIKEEIQNTILFTRAETDRWTWTISKHGNYTTASTYKEIRQIETPNKLQQLKILRSSKYIIYNQYKESTHHCFFNCSHSKNVWYEILRFIGLHRFSLILKDDWEWIMDNASRKTEMAGVVKACLAATLYWLWRERNDRRFKQKRKNEATLCRGLKEEIRRLLQSIMKELIDNMRNQCLIARLNIRINLRLPTQLSFIWEPPDPGELKLNTDGSVTPDSASKG
ncbi:hypothetical protein IFM89_036344 [Coptis chinensis]|uniref:Reverse transcriptase zinc-binding domain-containing protein n=1 Tax=Coptis chinensis TaxID=261450 RepID=A0A835HLR2_9MAGN|nr:hypothetical protein IFM89_036344 [Coptis chinensis]